MIWFILSLFSLNFVTEASTQSCARWSEKALHTKAARIYRKSARSRTNYIRKNTVTYRSKLAQCRLTNSLAVFGEVSGRSKSICSKTQSDLILECHDDINASGGGIKAAITGYCQSSGSKDLLCYTRRLNRHCRDSVTKRLNRANCKGVVKVQDKAIQLLPARGSRIPSLLPAGASRPK